MPGLSTGKPPKKNRSHKGWVYTRASARLDSRQRAKVDNSQRGMPASRRRAFLNIVKGLVVVGLFILGIRAYNSTFFKVSEVTVLGAQQLEPAQVIAAASLEGKNILAQDGREVADSLEKLPLVKKAKVAFSLPHEAVITIEERQPWAVWRADNTPFVIDDEGIVIGTTPPSIPLPVVENPGGGHYELGDRVDLGIVRLSLLLTEALPKETGAKAQSFEYTSQEGLVVGTDKGWRVRFGDGQNLEYKLAVLKEIIEKSSELKLSVNYLDLRSSSRVYIKG